MTCQLTSACLLLMCFSVTSVMFQVKDKLNDIETKLMRRPPGDLQNKTKDLKKKTEQNRQMATDAQKAADAAFNNTTDTQTVRILTDDVSCVSDAFHIFLDGRKIYF